MMAASKGRSFSPVGAVGVSAGGPPPVADIPPVSDSPSLEPRNIGHESPPVPAAPPAPVPPVPVPAQSGELDFSLTGLLNNRVDPDLDLITRSYDLPRYLVEALRLEAVRSRRPLRSLMADYLRQGLPAPLVAASRANAERGNLGA